MAAAADYCANHTSVLPPLPVGLGATVSAGQCNRHEGCQYQSREETDWRCRDRYRARRFACTLTSCHPLSESDCCRLLPLETSGTAVCAWHAVQAVRQATVGKSRSTATTKRVWRTRGVNLSWWRSTILCSPRTLDRSSAQEARIYGSFRFASYSLQFPSHRAAAVPCSSTVM